MNGKALIPFVHDTLLTPFNQRTPSYQYFIAKRGNKYGIFYIDGTIKADFIYDEIRFHKEGANIAKKKNKYGLLDATGKEVTPFIYDEMTNEENNPIIRVKKRKRYGFINLKGEAITSLKYKEADVFANNRAWVKEKKLFGAIDHKGNLVIPYQYDQVRRFQHDKEIAAEHINSNLSTTKFIPDYSLALVQKEGKWGVINGKGTATIPCKYDAIISPPSIYNKQQEKEPPIKTRKKEETEYPFHIKQPYFNYLHLAKVKNEGKYGAINHKGAVIIPPNYAQISDLNQIPIWAFNNDEQVHTYTHLGKCQDTAFINRYFSKSTYIPIRIDRLYGYIDAQGTIVIPCQYQKALAFKNGIGIVKQNGKWGVIDSIATFIIPPLYDRIKDNRIRGGKTISATKGKQIIEFNAKGEEIRVKQAH